MGFPEKTRERFTKLTLLSLATYISLLALIAKGIFFLGSQHPLKDDLPSVNGIVRELRLGGQGKSTWFQLETERGTHRYSSYYGVVWPGMERIRLGDRVRVRAERNKLNKNELVTGKQFYIWELIHDGRVIVAYQDVKELVEEKETALNWYADRILVASMIFLLIAYLRSRFMAPKDKAD